MKRLLLFAIPILATLAALGLAFLFIRSQGGTLEPRVASIRKAVGQMVEEVAEELGEAVE